MTLNLFGMNTIMNLLNGKPNLLFLLSCPYGLIVNRHYPIGLLYDLNSHNITLPWSITIHFKDLPTNLVLAKPTETTMQNMFMSMVKEVLYREGDVFALYVKVFFPLIMFNVGRLFTHWEHKEGHESI